MFDITDVATTGVCTDSFMVTGPTGRNPSVICGVNTGQHSKSTYQGGSREESHYPSCPRPEIYIQSAPNNSNETHTFMCLGLISIHTVVWAEPAILGSTKTAVKFKYEI